MSVMMVCPAVSQVEDELPHGNLHDRLALLARRLRSVRDGIQQAHPTCTGHGPTDRRVPMLWRAPSGHQEQPECHMDDLQEVRFEDVVQCEEGAQGHLQISGTRSGSVGDGIGRDSSDLRCPSSEREDRQRQGHGNPRSTCEHNGDGNLANYGEGQREVGEVAFGTQVEGRSPSPFSASEPHEIRGDGIDGGQFLESSQRGGDPNLGQHLAVAGQVEGTAKVIQLGCEEAKVKSRMERLWESLASLRGRIDLAGSKASTLTHDNST